PDEPLDEERGVAEEEVAPEVAPVGPREPRLRSARLELERALEREARRLEIERDAFRGIGADDRHRAVGELLRLPRLPRAHADLRPRVGELDRRVGRRAERRPE